MDIIKILGFALITATVYVILKQNKPEFAPIVVCAASAFIFIYVISGVINEIFSLQDMLEKMGLKSEYFFISFKALGIVCITSFAADVCRDSGSTSLENKVNFAGRCAVFITVFPILKGIAEAALEVMK